MNVGVLSGIVLIVAVIYAFRVNIAFFKRFGDESRKGWSQYYDVNLHQVMGDRPGENTGRLSIITLFLFLLALALMHFGL
jgi:hypothetical protein